MFPTCRCGPFAANCSYPVHNVPDLSTPLIVAAVLVLAPLLVAAFSPKKFAQLRALSRPLRLAAPLLLCIPYVLVSRSAGQFQWDWLCVYVALALAIPLLLFHASLIDPKQRGAWPDLVVLATLGLAVDLRWFEPAWPAGLAVFNKMLLLDLGIWGYVIVRQLHYSGFDLRIRKQDLIDGLLNFALYTPIAIILGLSLRFLHFHFALPDGIQAVGAYAFTFLFVAVPEELFFRGWVQNLLERRLGANAALIVTSILFGLSHFNKRAAHFNWRYVLLAAIAGVFYGRAWRAHRRLAASSITHATVDTIWSLWFR